MMAEAGVETSPRNKFFCHRCNVEINPNLPDFTCPQCESGFIEEMTEDLESSQESDSEPDMSTTIADVLGQIFHQYATRRSDSGPHNTIHSDTDDSNDTIESMAAQPRSMGDPLTEMFLSPFPGTRISIRTRQGGQVGDQSGLADQPNPALHGILQNILTSIIGGSFSEQGGHVLNLYGSPGDYAWGNSGLDNIITQLLNQIESTGPPPAKKEDIENLKELVISQSQMDKGLQCSVCMEDFKRGEHVKGLPCQHVYHEGCIVPWLELHGTCPVCRKSVTETTNSDEQHNELHVNNSRNTSSSAMQQSAIFPIQDEDVD